MATAVQELKTIQLIANDRERDYFTIPEFRLVKENLPDLRLELIHGQIVINPAQGRDYFTIKEFEVVAELLPDNLLELINGEIVMSPKPSNRHQQLTGWITTLFGIYVREILELGCLIAGSSSFYEIPEEIGKKFANPTGGFPSSVCPDASICYKDYLNTTRIPPALLVVEVLSDSNRRHIDRDMATKPKIYAALGIPTYWVIDRRSNSVWVYTKPNNGKYVSRKQAKGEAVLPAPGLEFLQITPAQIFND